MKDLPSLIRDGDVHFFDGAMGTLLYERGVFVNVCYDELNLTDPELVAGIHREYVDAGAEILETNTFGANPVKLSGFGLEEQTEEINRVAAALALRAAEGRALVVGAMGPLGLRIGPWGPTSPKEAEGYFRRQVYGLLEGGVDGFLLETFSDLNELKQALRAVRALSDHPLFAQVTFEEGGRSPYGADVESVASALEDWGADVLGVNCSVGPSETLDVVERLRSVTRLPIIAQPNAGLPRMVGDRKMYLSSPTYVARYAARMAEAGAKFLGGCCGTTPDHIREIRLTVRTSESGTRVDSSVSGAQRRRPQGAEERGLPSSVEGPTSGLREPVPLGSRSRLGERLDSNTFFTSFELVLPEGWDTTGLLAEARSALDAGADVLTVADPRTGPWRIGAITAAMLVAQDLDTDIEILLKYSCRDRTMFRMVSDMLGAASAGLHNVLVQSGDLTRTGPYPDRTVFFDLDSIGLANLLAHLNRGVDPGGHFVDPPTRFVVGVPLNLGAADREREEMRLRAKLEAGADFIVTSPVLDLEALDHFKEVVAAAAGTPVVTTVRPLASLRDAEYLSQEAVGIQVSEETLDRMKAAEARSRDAALEEGIQVAREVIKAVRPIVGGIHLTCPGGELERGLALLAEFEAAQGGSQGVY